MKHYQEKILTRLIISYLIPLSLFMAIGGIVYYSLAKESLDNEFGKRLIAIANAARAQISTDQLIWLNPGDEASRTFGNIRKKLLTLRDITGVRKIYIFDAQNRAMIDTDPNVLIGTQYTKDFDRNELDSVRSRGMAVASTLFKGNDGNFYKTGYVPLAINETVPAILGVDASVEFFQTLRNLRRNIWSFVMISMALIILVSFLFARHIERPIRELVRVAKTIELGELNSPIEISSRNELGYLGRCLDDMRKGLLHRDSSLKMMISGIAHEVRNPLGGMELFAGMLREELGSDHEKQSYVDKIIKEIQNLKKLVNEFLDYSRPVQIHRQEIVLYDFLSEVALLVADELQRKNVQFKMDFDRAIQLVCDPDLMQRVVLNVVHNSIQAMPEGGAIEVTCLAESGRRHLAFRDSGMGIGNLREEELFAPFFTTKQRGCGLGLALVKKIIDAHEGTIHLTPHPEKGVVVHIVIPE